jgi:exodeoxyribonuclease VII large subunit
MQQTNLPLSNVPEYSVSDLAFSLKKTLEDRYGRVRVRGELGRLTFHSSGHLYGTLKDDKANLDLICWRSSLSTLSIRPEEGLEVICTGKK